MASRPKCVVRSSALKNSAVGNVVASPSIGNRRAGPSPIAHDTAELDVPKSMPMERLDEFKIPDEVREKGSRHEYWANL